MSRWAQATQLTNEEPETDSISCSRTVSLPFNQQQVALTA